MSETVAPALAQVLDATAQARQASVVAGAARDEAESAQGGAARAERGAVAAEQGAVQARADADATRDAAVEATLEALQADALLLDQDAQKVAAQVSEEAPFGLPGGATNPRGLVRTGFTVTVGALAAIAVAAAVLALREELLLFVIAAFIAIGLEPAVAWLTRHGLRRGPAVLLVSLATIGLVAGFLAAAVPPIVNQATALVRQGPKYFADLQDRHTLLGRLNAQYHIEDKLTQAANQKVSVDSFGGLLNAGQAIVSSTVEVLLVLALVVYFLADFDDIKRACYRLAPLPRRPRIALLGDEILARTGGYILGNLLTSAIALVCQYVVLRVLGVPYAFVLSVFVGILDLVPLVGSTIAGALVVLIALAAVSPTAAVVDLAFTVIYRIAEDYVISPRVLRRTVDVRPVVTVVAVIIGGALLGMVGALVAVPAAAAVQLLLTEVVYPRMDTAPL